MFRVFLFFLIFGLIVGGLIFANWEVIKKINKSVIVSIVSLFLALVLLIVIIRFQSAENKYKSGKYLPAHFKDGVLQKEQIE